MPSNAKDEQDAKPLAMQTVELRDWFAGMALQGMLAGTASADPDRAENNAAWAYSLADAMLAERKRVKP